LKRLFDLYDVDPDGLKKNGFYEYVLSGDRTLIWHRVFSDKQQRQAYANQSKKCGGRCGRELPFNEIEIQYFYKNGSSSHIITYTFESFFNSIVISTKVKMKSVGFLRFFTIFGRGHLKNKKSNESVGFLTF